MNMTNNTNFGNDYQMPGTKPDLTPMGGECSRQRGDSINTAGRMPYEGNSTSNFNRFMNINELTPASGMQHQ